MSEPPVDAAAPDAGTQTAPSSSAETGKVTPENLVLRAAPRRVVRFRRGVIVAGAAVASLAITGVAWMALGPKTLQLVQAEEKAITDRHTPADAVANLPGDYSKVTPTTPILGAPLPGDREVSGPDQAIPSRTAIPFAYAAAGRSRRPVRRSGVRNARVYASAIREFAKEGGAGGRDARR